VVCDFGADHAFGEVNAKLKEHYGITVPTSAPRAITEYHAKQISGREDLQKIAFVKAKQIVAECDGSMIPIVETNPAGNEAVSKDRRKNKTLCWKEARLTLAHAEGSKSLCFAGTMESVEIAGQQLSQCVLQAGGDKRTKIHCVGDGAVWIANQVEEQFGANGSYLIDFYHLCEYLSAAAVACAGKGDEAAWLTEQKARMKQNRYKEVLNTLYAHIEPRTVEESAAPVRACYRYIKNRPEQLNYKEAIEKELPIGSGEVESAHRYVIQKRLKLAGAWWNIDNAKNMISIRTCRANELWDDYWEKAA
jgi:hypothetical protein